MSAVAAAVHEFQSFIDSLTGTTPNVIGGVGGVGYVFRQDRETNMADDTDYDARVDAQLAEVNRALARFDQTCRDAMRKIAILRAASTDDPLEWAEALLRANGWTVTK